MDNLFKNMKKKKLAALLAVSEYVKLDHFHEEKLLKMIFFPTHMLNFN